jgi:dGTPase
MRWERLISAKRLGMEAYHDPRRHTRSTFQRDYDRMIFSSPFRRLQNKTQVFPLPGSIFVHNRLTHSLEVSSVGRSMANEVSRLLRERHSDAPWAKKLHELGDIVATACLCHDLGNPPFGHSGEKTISTFFSEGEGLELKPLLTERQWADLINFEGNANSFRLLTHRFVGRREGGFAMTYSVLASIVKYPHSSLFAGDKGKFGYFESEEGIWRLVAEELGIPELRPGVFARHPLVYIMEAADDICYQIMDLEDAHKLKIVNHQEVADLFLGFFEDSRAAQMRRTMARLDDPNERVAYLRSNVIGALVEDCARVFVENEDGILSGKMQGSLVEKTEPMLSEAYAACSEKAWEKIYRAPEVVDIEIAGNRIITYLMRCLVEAVMHPEKNFSRLLLEKVPKQYDTRADSVYGRIQSALDHISGMTDVYALDLFRKLNGHSLPAV